MTKSQDAVRASSFAPIKPEEIPYLEAVGAEIRRLRDGQGLSRTVLGRWVGMSPRYLQWFEAGCRRPRRSTLARLAHVLGADLEGLVKLAGPAMAPESKSSRIRALRPLPPEPPPAPPRPKKPEPQPPPGRWWEGDEDVWDDGAFVP